LVDLLLDGTATLLASDYATAVPILREAAAVLRSGAVSREDVATWFNLGLVIADELWDDETYGTWADLVEQRARDEGALIALQVALIGRAKAETRAGQFDAAEATYDEAVDITRAIGGVAAFYELLRADLHAWRGDEAATETAAAALHEGGAAIGSGPAVGIAHLARATLALGTGRYEEAFTWARHRTDEFLLGWTCQGLSITVEAAARVGQVDLAQAWLAQLAERAAATATPWALGQLARSRALLAPDEAAETLYQQALAELARTSVATETAHTHLVFGEWLRRQNRRGGCASHTRHRARDVLVDGRRRTRTAC
jgi:tetratricopeptide (TPR) repeat protein